MIPNAAKGVRSLTAADYARAERLLPGNAEQLVLHSVESPTWLPSGRLWYRTRTARGLALVLVDPLRRTRKTIFDQTKLARALQSVSPESDQAGVLSENLRLSADEMSVSFEVAAKRWQCDLDGRDCRLSQPPDSSAALSPDKRRVVFVRDHNLWLKELATGREIRLTRDGAKDFAYATDNSGRQRSGRPCVLWSPDSRRVATFQQDQRDVGDMYLVTTERGHPMLETWKYPMPCDAVIPMIERVIIDVDECEVVRLKMPRDYVRSASWLGLSHGETGVLEAQWSDDGKRLAFISISRDHRRACLRVADAERGVVRDILEESAVTYYEAAISASHAVRAVNGTPNWRILDAGSECIWYSARDGWSHLYLYDLANGQLKRQITSGDWNVVQLLCVDETRRVAFFMAVGRESGSHPYYEYLYRIDLDGGAPVLLTPEDATHSVCMSSASEYFLDRYSKPDAAPIAVLRDRAGKVLRRLETADVSRLVALGWKAPALIEVKARDGSTNLYGLMFKPSHFDESHKYPIVNYIYSGAILGSVIACGSDLQWGSFSAAHGLLGDAHALAELGFVVVMIDGLGTPLRSRQFSEATYANYGDATLPDQVAVMKQLAQRHKWIDLDRTGIYGHSGGGYRAARAMLTYPDFFKVGIAISGNHDPMSYQDEYSEKFIGPYVRAPDGTSNYDREANLGVAANLRGHLLLVHGMLDANVPHYQTLLLADALIDANKDFDLLLLPRQTHAIERGAHGRYLIRRCWDYFVRHLLGIQPPREYQMDVPRAVAADATSGRSSGTAS